MSSVIVHHSDYQAWYGEAVRAILRFFFRFYFYFHSHIWLSPTTPYFKSFFHFLFFYFLDSISFLFFCFLFFRLCTFHLLLFFFYTFFSLFSFLSVLFFFYSIFSACLFFFLPFFSFSSVFFFFFHTSLPNVRQRLLQNDSSTIMLLKNGDIATITQLYLTDISVSQLRMKALRMWYRT